VALDSWRCQRCNHLLAKVALSAGSTVEIVCHTCGAKLTKQANPLWPIRGAETLMTVDMRKR